MPKTLQCKETDKKNPKAYLQNLKTNAQIQAKNVEVP